MVLIASIEKCRCIEKSLCAKAFLDCENSEQVQLSKSCEQSCLNFYSLIIKMHLNKRKCHENNCKRSQKKAKLAHLDECFTLELLPNELILYIVKFLRMKDIVSKIIFFSLCIDTNEIVPLILCIST